ncbi:hypothetical protein [Acetobacter indonesiensis]|nr:hypothetical protein [Acetobacter indonesiensis]
MMPGRSENFAPPVPTPPRHAPFRARNALSVHYTLHLHNTGETTL